MSKDGRNGKRVYIVTEHPIELPGTVKVTSSPPVPIERLVRATSQSQAISHVVRGRFEAMVASTDDVIRLRDVPVQDAGSE